MTPVRIRVRAYNVGFGDCFLMTFFYADATERHVLIDFGSTKMATRGPGSMKAIADKIAEDSSGKLQIVAVTHRHADHISGFAGASGWVIKGLDPELVVQPWTEDPDLEPDAKAPSGGATRAGAGMAAAGQQRVTASLADMNAVARRINAQSQKLAVTSKTPPKTAEEIHFLGETNIKNPDAVRALIALGKKHVYASFGTRLPTASILPGVQIDVLGPPTLRQAPTIAQLTSTNATEYWHLAAKVAQSTTSGATRPIFPDAPTIARTPVAARWLIPQVDKMNGEELLSIVRSIDDALNNTSLILLFDIGGTLLLFPGDAQIENWSYALFDAADHDAIRARLAQTSLYKVGHHGSLNATPKTLWSAFVRRRELPPFDGRLKAVISTLSGKHGKVTRGTEVPRRKLMDALETQTDLSNTQRLGAKTFWRDAEIDIPQG
jgi:hypothetical protein